MTAKWAARAAGSVGGLSTADWAQALEPRRLLSVVPTLSAPGAAYLGAPYVVGISTTSWDDAYNGGGLNVDWGDGTVNNLGIRATSASHVYQSCGSYEVTLTAPNEDADGDFSSISDSANVDASVDDPWLGVDGASSVDQGSTYTIYPGFSDPASQPVEQYTANWADGSVDTYSPNPDGTFPPFTHIFDWAGDYSAYGVSLAATTDTGSYTAGLSVTVDPVTPTVPVSGYAPDGNTTDVSEGSIYTLDVGFSDPDGRQPDGNVSVDWNDGSFDSFANCDPAGGIQLSHVYSRSGDFTPVVSVGYVDFSNPDGMCAFEDPSAAGQTAVTVDPVPPSLSICGPGDIDPNAEYDLNASFFDPQCNPAEGFSVWWGDSSFNSYDGDAGLISHVYSQAGNYEIDATAFNADGAADASTNLIVNDVQASGGANIPESANQYSAYTITAYFDDPAGTPATAWAVSWGDGTTANYPVPADNGAGAAPGDFGTDDAASGTFTHVYTQAGEFNVVVDTSYIRGSYGSSGPVDVQACSPDVWASGPSEIATPDTFNLDVGYSDSTGDPVVNSWIFYWGDTTSDIDNNPSLTDSFSHQYAAPGNYCVTAVAETGFGPEQGGFDAATSVQVDAVLPGGTAYAFGPSSVEQSSPYALFADFSPTGGDGVSAWSINWDDGSCDSGGPDASSFIHDFTQPGTYAVVATVTDLEGNCGFEASTQVVVTPLSPTVSASGNADTAEGSQYTLNVGYYDAGVAQRVYARSCMAAN
jgi:PKD repeat protein